MNDQSIMPFGKHKGKLMIEVPDNYLLWLWWRNKEEYKNGFSLQGQIVNVMEYIEDCFDAKDLL